MKRISVEQKAALVASARRVAVKQTTQFASGKVNIEKRQVTTNAMVPFSANLNGYRILPDEIDAAMDSYMGDYQLVGRNHTEVTNSYPIRAWTDFDGSAWVTTQVEDEQDWIDIANGVFKGTSWAGTAYAVDIPPELAATLGVPDGTWLFDISWIENSFVTEPAVPEAVFNAADGMPDEPQSLVADVIAGKVKPRVTSRKPRRNALQLLQGLIKQTLQSLISTAPNGGDIVLSEDTEMGMTPEEIARFDELAQKLDTLTASVGELVEARDAARAALESATELAEVMPTETPEVVTLEQMNEGIASALKPLADELAALKAQPAPSAKLASDGGDAKPKATGPPLSSLAHDDPAWREFANK